MVTVNVPDTVKPVIERVALIPQQDFDSLLVALGDAKASLKSEQIAAHVRSVLSSEMPDLSELIDVMSNMAAGAQRSISVEEFAKGIAHAVLEKPPWLKKDKEKQPDPAILEKRLFSLLTVRSIAVSARANEIQHQYENLFSSARILSDIRTVFDPSKAAPTGAVIVHNLQIKYFHGSEYREAFFALDNADIAKLRKVLDRADEKTASLESVITKAGLDYFDSK